MKNAGTASAGDNIGTDIQVKGQSAQSDISYFEWIVIIAVAISLVVFLIGEPIYRLMPQV